MIQVSELASLTALLFHEAIFESENSRKSDLCETEKLRAGAVGGEFDLLFGAVARQRFSHIRPFAQILGGLELVLSAGLAGPAQTNAARADQFDPRLRTLTVAVQHQFKAIGLGVNSSDRVSSKSGREMVAV